MLPVTLLSLQLLSTVGLAELAELGRSLGAADLGGGEGGRVHARSGLLLNLLLDPLVGDAEPVRELDRGVPPELLLDHGVLGVAAAHALGPGDVLDGELVLAIALARADGHHLVHRHHLVGAEVHGLAAVGLGETEDALHAVVNEGEGAGLLAVAPHLNLLSGGDGLAAEGSRGFLAAALPGAVGAVDVVEAGNAGLDVEVGLVVLVHLLGAELLEAVGVLGL
mmetsp:Transcript_29774/g.95758  ORF Transcript_29774/g.95758 Transcript_29774/m.95758 type:complete len:223 (-) Transcript_29774:653-1321(-)